MRRPVQLLVAALVAAALLLPAAGSGGSATDRRAFVLGDSLAEGTAPYLPRYLPGWTLQQRYEVGYHLTDGVAAMRARAAALPPFVVVSLGTNDDPRLVAGFRRGVLAILAAAGPNRCVVWPNIVRPPAVGASYAGYNRVLETEATSHPTLRVVDWAALVHTHPEWLRRDGVHTTATGYRARAAAIAHTLGSC